MARNNFLLQHKNRRQQPSFEGSVPPFEGSVPSSRRTDLQAISAHQPCTDIVQGQSVKYGLWLFFVIFVITALIILYLWQDAALLQLNLQLATIEEQITEIEAKNRQLEFQVQQAFSLERISIFARQRLKMVEPTDIRYITIPLPE